MALDFLNKPIMKGVLVAINAISLIVVYGVTGIQAATDNTKNEFRKNAIVIVVFSILVMLTWWGLSYAVLTNNPALKDPYMYFMLAFVMSLSLISISISSMSQLQ